MIVKANAWTIGKDSFQDQIGEQRLSVRELVTEFMTIKRVRFLRQIDIA